MSGLDNHIINTLVEETTKYVNEKSKNAKGKKLDDTLILDAEIGRASCRERV